MTTDIKVAGSITGLSTGAIQGINKVIANLSTSVFFQTVVTLASGTNTITVPAATSGCIIVLPSTNTYAVTLKGVGGDTGFVIGKAGVQVLTWELASPPASFVLSTGTLHTAATYITFF